MSVDTDPRRVVIVGGGLAGLGLGVGLRRAGIPVTVFEAGDYPRHRVCGEFITGLPDSVLARLGIEEVFEGVLRNREVDWFWGGRWRARLRLPEPALGVSRFQLDARLANLFTAHGGQLMARHRVQPWEAGEGVVWTTGRPRRNGAPWVGLKTHVRGLELSADLEVHLGDGAYVGLSRVEDRWVNVCGIWRRSAGLRGDSAELLAETLRSRGMEALGERVRKAEVRRGAACAVAGFEFDREVRRGGDLVLGDACAVVPPFVGHGMAMAFIGAALALAPLVSWARHETSWDETRGQIHGALRREFSLRLKGAGWLHPLLLGKKGQACLTGLVKTGLLPMRALYGVLH